VLPLAGANDVTRLERAVIYSDIDEKDKLDSENDTTHDEQTESRRRLENGSMGMRRKESKKCWL
jgi:hypothetical protein